LGSRATEVRLGQFSSRLRDKKSWSRRRWRVDTWIRREKR
jgi:hypothetical protein